MARDVRELMLKRILVILESIDGYTAYRNRGEFPKESLPALILLDGSGFKKTETKGGGRSRMSHFDMVLTPQIFIVLRALTQANNDGVGEALSAAAMLVLDAIVHDDELWYLMGADSGQIEWTNYDTDMQTGSSMTGSMRLDLAFTYVFDPEDLR